jgi:hypothetical protein
MRFARIVFLLVAFNLALITISTITFKLVANRTHTECDEVDAARQCESEASWTKAAYFSVQTITTVGYGASLELRACSIRIVAIVFMLLGTLAFSITIAVLASFVVRQTQAGMVGDLPPQILARNRRDGSDIG